MASQGQGDQQSHIGTCDRERRGQQQQQQPPNVNGKGSDQWLGHSFAFSHSNLLLGLFFIRVVCT
jgi:hypothetical protein